jgi:hypothetical protein
MKNQVFFAKLFLYLTILLAGIGCTNTSDTPENTINGTVQDSNGNGISTVTITSNTGVTTTTDSDGNYSIETDRSGTLTYTKEDFISNKVDINFSKLLNITLQTDLFSTSYFATANNTIADPNFRTSSLQPSSNITATTPNNSWYSTATYKGAIDANGTPWYDGWSYLSKILTGQNIPSLGTTTKPKKIIKGNTWAPPVNSIITWSKDTVYVLDGFVFVDSSITLRIPAGTVIQGNTGQQFNASALIITKHGRIEANGTAAEPIVFTYTGDDGNKAAVNAAQTEKGKWGGLILLGDALLNSSPGNSPAEGLPFTDPRGSYGGNNDGHNGGVLRYVSIRHGGTDIGAGNEINGLTLAGVGNNTTIEYVEVIGNKDDGIEWFGGTVNAKYLISAYSSDDGIDYDEGYRGLNQFVVILQDPLEADNGGEHDGGTTPETGTPLATPEFWNVTALGNNTSAALIFRDNAGGEYHNSIFSGFGTGVAIEDLIGESIDTYERFENGDLKIEHNIFHNIGQLTTGSDIFVTTNEN